jgi:hypothetical protein
MHYEAFWTIQKSIIDKSVAIRRIRALRQAFQHFHGVFRAPLFATNTVDTNN